MTGTIVNVGAIVAASLIGSRVKKGIKEEYQGAMFNAMGLAALMLGVHSAAEHVGQPLPGALYCQSGPGQPGGHAS